VYYPEDGHYALPGLGFPVVDFLERNPLTRVVPERFPRPVSTVNLGGFGGGVPVDPFDGHQVLVVREGRFLGGDGLIIVTGQHQKTK